MKKKIVVTLIALAALVGAVAYQALPSGADTPGPLDHVTVTPPTATVAVGGTVQFVAQGSDAANLGLDGLSFAWSVTPATGAGTVSATTGLYTAGTTAGTVTVQVIATQGAISKSATTTITVTAAATPVPVAAIDVAKLSKLLNGYLNAVGFENFLGGQWQVKNGTATDTIKATAGVVQAVTPTGLTVLANGQTSVTSFTLASTTAILPKGTQLVATDKVVAITVNDQLVMVVKITPPSAKTWGNEPPGLKNNEHAKRDDGKTPPGWSQGKKTGWGKDHGERGESNEKD